MKFLNMKNQKNVLDVDRITEIRDSLGSVVLAGLFERYLKEGDSLLDNLTNSEISKEPLKDVIAEVHKVAGSAAVLGTIEMHAKLQLIETVGKSEGRENIRMALNELEPVWLRTKSSLHKLGFVIS